MERREKSAVDARKEPCFEDVLFALQAGDLLDDGLHPNVEKYPHQRMLVVKIGDYACLVPYVETQDEIFLKTIVPSRKATRKYLRGAK